MKLLLKILFVVTALFFIQKTNAQLSPTVNMTLRSKLPFNTSGSNICGYADAANGKEYALFGNGTGTAIVDVTNPVAPVVLHQVGAVSSLWREIKVYRNYAYITTEGGGQGLQIVNLSALPTTITSKSYFGGDSILTNIQNIHALHIDTAKGYVYLFGGNSVITPIGGVATNTGGVAVVLDIKTDPWNPKFVGTSPKINNNSGDYYIHDGYVRGDTLYGGHIYNGFFSIIDFRNKKAPILLNTQTTPSAFNHNNWLSDDSKTLFTTDERAASYLAAYDVSDPLSIKFLDKIRTVSEAGPTVHNVHVLNDFLVTSWYTEGVTIVDAHRPQNLVQVGQYDTYAGVRFGFAGTWGVYPYLPSGNLVISNYGAPGGDTMYVVTPQYIRASYLEGTTTDANTGALLSGVLVKINSSDMDKKAQSDIQGKYRTGQVTEQTVSVTYSKTGYITQTVTGIILKSGTVVIQNVALVPIIIPIELIDFQGVVENNKTKLTWQTATEINVARFEVERNALENGKESWQTIGTTKPNNAPSNYTLFDEKPTIGTNYYRLKTTDADGRFSYSNTIAVTFGKAKTAVSVYPNPAKGLIFLSENSFPDAQIVEVLDIVGKVVLQTTIGQTRSGMDIQNLANGSYILKIGEGVRLRFTKG
jgi:choice-of-anchor B domain-containing protein